MKNLLLAILIGTIALLQSGQAQVPTQEQLQSADAQLNQVYQQLRGSLNADQKQQLKVAQRDWIKKRDAYVAANPGNPQGAFYQATMERVAPLQEVLQQVRGQRVKKTPNQVDTSTGLITTQHSPAPDSQLRVEFSDDASGYSTISEKAGLLATATDNEITLWDLKTGHLIVKKPYPFTIKGLRFKEDGKSLMVIYCDDPRYGGLKLTEVDINSLEISVDSKKLDIFRGMNAQCIIGPECGYIVVVEEVPAFQVPNGPSFDDSTQLILYAIGSGKNEEQIPKKSQFSLKGLWKPGEFIVPNFFTVYGPNGKTGIISIEDIIVNNQPRDINNNPTKQPVEYNNEALNRTVAFSNQCDAIVNKINNEAARLEVEDTSKIYLRARDKNLFLWNIEHTGSDINVISNIKNTERIQLKDTHSILANTAGKYNLFLNSLKWIGDQIMLQSEFRSIGSQQRVSDVKPITKTAVINLESLHVYETNAPPLLGPAIHPRDKDELSVEKDGSVRSGNGKVLFKIPTSFMDICYFPLISFSPDHKHFILYGDGQKNHAAPVECYDLNLLSDKPDVSLVHKDDTLTSSEVSLKFYPFILFIKSDCVVIKSFGSDDILSKWGTDSAPGYAEAVDFAVDTNHRRIAVLGRGRDGQPDRMHLLQLSKDGILNETALIKLAGKSLLTLTPDYFYSFRGDAIKEIHFVKGFHPFPLEQFDLRLNRPDIVLDRLGAPKEAIDAAKFLRDKRLKRMGVTEKMLQPDFHLPEVQILGDVPATTAKDQLDLQIKATDDKYPLDRLRVYVNNVPVNGRDGELLRDQKTQNLEKTIPIKLAAGRNKIQVSVLNSAGAESLYANAEVNCTAVRPKPKLYAVALGVSQYDRPEWCLKYAAKDATDLIGKIKEKAGSSYSEVKPLLLTDKDVTKESAAKIKQFLSGATIDDTVVIFMAGHGILDDKYDYYFGTTDIDPAKPSERGMPYEAIDNILAEVPSLKKALLMDTCHAGELDDDEKKELAASDGKSAPVATDSSLKGKIAVRSIGTRGMTVQAVQGAKGKSDWYEKLQDMFVDLRRGSGATVISSSQGAEYAFESSEQSNGLFTYALMEAMDGKATPSKDGQITISSVGDYVKKRVQDLTKGKQNPNLRGVNLEEDFSLSSSQ
jgi:ElaB/YqjD/DUF883 family membrane-anchored ribosome-binding protein